MTKYVQPLKHYFLRTFIFQILIYFDRTRKSSFYKAMLNESGSISYKKKKFKNSFIEVILHENCVHNKIIRSVSTIYSQETTVTILRETRESKGIVVLNSEGRIYGKQVTRTLTVALRNAHWWAELTGLSLRCELLQTQGCLGSSGSGKGQGLSGEIQEGWASCQPKQNKAFKNLKGGRKRTEECRKPSKGGKPPGLGQGSTKGEVTQAV